MTEKRICWVPEIEQAFGVADGCGTWLPCSTEDLETLVAIQHAGIESYGPGRIESNRVRRVVCR